jgi:hypothetical protein
LTRGGGESKNIKSLVHQSYRPLIVTKIALI